MYVHMCMYIIFNLLLSGNHKLKNGNTNTNMKLMSFLPLLHSL